MTRGKGSQNGSLVQRQDCALAQHCIQYMKQTPHTFAESFRMSNPKPKKKKKNSSGHGANLIQSLPGQGFR